MVALSGARACALCGRRAGAWRRRRRAARSREDVPFSAIPGLHERAVCPKARPSASSNRTRLGDRHERRSQAGREGEGAADSIPPCAPGVTTSSPELLAAWDGPPAPLGREQPRPGAHGPYYMWFTIDATTYEGCWRRAAICAVRRRRARCAGAEPPALLDAGGVNAELEGRKRSPLRHRLHRHRAGLFADAGSVVVGPAGSPRTTPGWARGTGLYSREPASAWPRSRRAGCGAWAVRGPQRPGHRRIPVERGLIVGEPQSSVTRPELVGVQGSLPRESAWPAYRGPSNALPMPS